MQGFAYRHSRHHAVIHDARAGDWMPESVFVRFEIESIQGDPGGRLAWVVSEAIRDSGGRLAVGG
jgi:hypothetical protein